MIASLSKRPRVLIVGAGPVGLVAAIRLREQGVPVRIIDEHVLDNKRTYPVLLHPRTLEVLASLGVTAPLEWRGRFIKHLAVYIEQSRRMVVDLPSAGEVAPGALTLPQDVLRKSLMQKLADLGGEVEWQTRLVALEQDGALVRAGLVRRERIEGQAPMLKPEWLDVASETDEVDFVIGADGVGSTVRRALGVEMVERGQREAYLFYDAVDHRSGDGAYLAIDHDHASSVYPLQGDISRFSFQVSALAAHAPDQHALRALLAERMPWYAAEAGDFQWSGAAEFHPACASSFGHHRVWLAGDAAHSTGPLGGQSINVGIFEGDDLAQRIALKVLEHPGPLGPGYAEERRAEWNRTFGLGHSKPSLVHAPDWVSQNMTRLLPCLPVSSYDLDHVLEQLRLGSA